MEWKVSEIIDPEKLNINQWAEEDRPREKLEKLGAEALSTAELLAILIGSGSSKENAVELMKKVLNNCGNSLKALGQMSIKQLCSYHGIGEAKAITILAACELGKRRENEEQMKREEFSDSKDIYEYLIPRMRDLDVEESYLILMNQSCKHIKTIRLSHGGFTETAVDVRVIIREAVTNNATVVAIAHNHPSGNLNPSREDDRLTQSVKDACKLMRIHLLDHLIITDGDYYSYRENGKI